jgi:hypothetical protein
MVIGTFRWPFAVSGSACVSARVDFTTVTSTSPGTAKFL